MKALNALFLVVAFGAGIGTGFYAAKRSQPVESSVSDTPLLTGKLAADTGMAIAYLYRLRDGRTNEVVSILESRIDSDVVMLAERLAALPVIERDSNQVKIVQMHREYRSKFPYSNSIPYISEGIVKAYTLLDQPAESK